MAGMGVTVGASIGKALGKAAIGAAVPLSAGVVLGIGAYKATGAMSDKLGSDEARPRPEHSRAVTDGMALVPVTVAGMGAAAGAVMLASQKVTRRTPIVIEREVAGKIVTETANTVTTGLRGMTFGPKVLAGGGLGILVGTGIAAGLAVPVMTAVGSLIGKGTDAAVRGMMPDWLEGAAGGAGSAVGAVGDAIGGAANAVGGLLNGPGPTVHHYTIDQKVEPGTFDPSKMLPNGDLPPVTVDAADNIDQTATGIVLDAIEQQTGARPQEAK